MPSIAEQATEHFYEWEYLGRGYQLFKKPVYLEPPFFPYHHFEQPENNVLDDGRVPTVWSQLFQSIKELAIPKKGLAQEQEPDLDVNIFDSDPTRLKGFTLSFVQGQEINPFRSTEFLNMISFTQEKVSFEIIGSSDRINIQIVCAESDFDKIQAHLKAHFPEVLLNQIEDPLDLPFNTDRDKMIAVADLALGEEYMRPFAIKDNFNIDPLTAIITTLDHLQNGEVALFQVLFKGVSAPWSTNMLISVSDGIGGSFFSNSPEMPMLTKAKVSAPLFSSVFRIATQGSTKNRSEYLARELIQSLQLPSTSETNQLIALSNEGYEYNQHVLNIFYRKSNRWGMFLNSKELAQFVHYPNYTIFSKKLGVSSQNSKEVPNICTNQNYSIGINVHQGQKKKVSLNDEMRLRHTYIIGATGVGKSTLIANMVQEDIKAGNGCALFDPHGDIIDDVMGQIPEERIKDVILIDPSDTHFPIGFNLLHATTEAEKIVLSSDLVSAFKEHASAWGDQMTSVLSNAINSFLDSERIGTLIELKRFLLEKTFRDQYLKSVSDPSIHYYWEHEFSLLKKGALSPLLTRIDSFLRPKIIRSMLAQHQGVDFSQAMAQKKILLIKLSQGLIGEDNSYLLASIFLTKLLQSAQGRANISKSERSPYYLYLDEFHNFLTPSITQILSGARKYGLGLVLAHQELSQIDNPKILGSLISNPYIRICFRLGDADSKRLEQGFSGFSADDLQSLGIGEAIMRVGKSSNDFNIQTFLPPEIKKEQAEHTKTLIVQQSRQKYAQTREEVDVLLESLLPNIGDTKRIKKQSNNDEEKLKKESGNDEIKIKDSSNNNELKIKETSNNDQEKLKLEQDDFERQKLEYLEDQQKKSELKEHRKIQNEIRKYGQENGFLSTIEKEITGGKRIDVFLERADISIACEVSVNNTVDYEIENIQKCLAEATIIIMTSPKTKHLENIHAKALQVFNKNTHKRIKFIPPHEIQKYISSFQQKKKSKEKIVRGYKVKVEQSKIESKSLKAKLEMIVNVISRNLKKE